VFNFCSCGAAADEELVYKNNPVIPPGSGDAENETSAEDLTGWQNYTKVLALCGLAFIGVSGVFYLVRKYLFPLSSSPLLPVRIFELEFKIVNCNNRFFFAVNKDENNNQVLPFCEKNLLFYISGVLDEVEKIRMYLLYPVKAELLTPYELSSVLGFRDAIAFNIVEREGKHFATSITELNNDPTVIEKELPPDRRECDIFLRRGSREEQWVYEDSSDVALPEVFGQFAEELEEEGGLRGRIRLVVPEPGSRFYRKWGRAAKRRILVGEGNKLIVNDEETENNIFPWDERSCLHCCQEPGREEIYIFLIIPEEIEDDAIYDADFLMYVDEGIYSLYVERKSESEKWTYENCPDITVPSVFEMFIKVSDDELRGYLMISVPDPEESLY
jgi:hypothetical protein